MSCSQNALKLFQNPFFTGKFSFLIVPAFSIFSALLLNSTPPKTPFKLFSSPKSAILFNPLCYYHTLFLNYLYYNFPFLSSDFAYINIKCSLRKYYRFVTHSCIH